MNYSLHPEASEDLRDAASFYREQAGPSLSQSFLGEVEQSINRLLVHLHSVRRGADEDDGGT